jgi:hypothetical protein
MKTKTFSWAACATSVLVLAVAIVALAEPRTPERFSGTINDYSPVNSMPPGPWEIRGSWDLVLKGESGKADFSAELTMEEGDYWFSQNVTADDPSPARAAHTHHITLVDGAITRTSTGGYELTGPVTATKDGVAVAALASSSAVIVISGGTTVEFSNVTLTLTGPATGHFGTQPIHGVVRKVKYCERGDQR